MKTITERNRKNQILIFEVTDYKNYQIKQNVTALNLGKSVNKGNLQVFKDNSNSSCASFDSEWSIDEIKQLIDDNEI